MNENPQGLATCARPAKLASASTTAGSTISNHPLHACCSDAGWNGGSVATVGCRGKTVGIMVKTCRAEETACARVIVPYDTVRTEGVTLSPRRVATASSRSTTIRSTDSESRSRRVVGGGEDGTTNQTVDGEPPRKASAIARHVAHFAERKTTMVFGSTEIADGKPIVLVVSSPLFRLSGIGSSLRLSAPRISLSCRKISTIAAEQSASPIERTTSRAMTSQVIRQ